MNRLDEYLAYHRESLAIGDIDPSYKMLLYVCERFELNEEQRYWLAFVYALTYCGASVYYVYNEFPDYENLDSGRLNRWWSANREGLVFQTDRRWIRSNNQFVPAIESYRDWIGNRRQAEHFQWLLSGAETPEARYDRLYASASKSLYAVGQFAMFLYLEALHTITPLDLEPTDLDLKVAHSCRNGLCYAYGLDHLIAEGITPVPAGGYEAIDKAWRELKTILRTDCTIWNIETTLCAYKKYRRGDRYIGYYLDRQALEIAKMSKAFQNGVAWDVLWDYRSEYRPEYRIELGTHWILDPVISRERKVRMLQQTGALTGATREGQGLLW